MGSRLASVLRVFPLVLALLLAVVAGAAVLRQRVAVESANRSVELVADLEEFETFALRQGQPLGQVLAQLAESGVTSLAVTEMTPARLVRRGQATLLAGADLQAAARRAGQLAPLLARLLEAGEIDPTASYLLLSDAPTFERVRDAACQRLAQKCRTWWEEGVGLLEVPLHIDRFRQFGLGLWPEDLLIAQRHGLAIVPRFADYATVTPQSVEDAFTEVARYGRLTTVIFSGDAVLGAQAGGAALAATAEQLRQRGLTVGLIETSSLLGHIPQQGMDTLLELVGFRAARVYSMPPDYLARLTPEEAVDIWARSPRERAIRVLYLRPLPSDADDPLRATVESVRMLSQRLRAEGWELGQAGTYPFYRLSTLPLLFLLAGAAALAVALLMRFVPLRPGGQFLLCTVVWLGFLLVWRGGGRELAREGAALLVAIVTPALAMDVVLARWHRRAGQLGSSVRALVRGGADASLAAAIALAGGLLLGAILGDVPYLLELRYFRGVKVSLLLPPLLTLLLYAWRFGADGLGAPAVPLRERCRMRWEQLRRSLVEPVRWWHLLLAGGLLLAGAVYILRSGNLTQDYVPAYELVVREALERTLLVRPRFKEFLIGYPALMLGSWLLARGMRSTLWLPAFIGTIGLVSAINSFEHVRTPLWVSLLRGCHGLWLGLFVGAVVVLVAELISRSVLHLLRHAALASRGGGQP